MNPTLIIGGVLAVVLGVYAWHCETVKSDRASLIATLRAQAAEAQRAADARATKDKQRQETTNAELQKARRALAVERKRLRDHRASASVLPPTSPAATRPDRITFDRTLLDGALRGFIAEAGELVAEGDEAGVALNAARRWAHEAE